MGGFWRSLALACSLSPLVLADPAPVPSLELVERQTNNNTNGSAATWIFQGGPPAGVDRDGDGQGPPPGRGPPEGRGGGVRGNITFSITVNPANDDMWFRIAAPAMYSWIGIAAGTSMGSTKAFLMAWEGEKEDSITLTARSACDKCEPAYLQHLGVNSRETSSTDPARYGIRDGMYYISGFIANGTRRAGIDPNKRDQPFIWAVGEPGHRPHSDAFDAPLKMHSRHGRFALDMTGAHGTALPAFATTENAVAQQGGAARSDEERGSTGHALLMCVGFVLILPLGIVLLKLTSVKAHLYTQAVGLIIITVGWITGFVISGRYQRSRNFDSTHQIIGIVVYLLLLAQFTTGLLHHRIWLKTQQPTWLIKPHKFGLGGVVLALGIINCALGFRFANDQRYNMIFVPVVIAIIVLLFASVFFKRFRQRRKKAAGGAAYPNMFSGPPPPESYRAPSGSAVPPAQGYYGAGGSTVGASWDQRSDVELNKMGPPPSYSAEPQKPREMI